MKIPYQRYAKHGFDETHLDIREFHAKQQYSLLKNLKNRAQLFLNFSSAEVNDLVGKEIEFWPGFEPDVLLPAPQRNVDALIREKSKDHFSDVSSFTFSEIAQFVSDTLTFTEFDGVCTHRMYPSGGALYPIEVFLCRLSENTPGWRADQPVFHLRANSRCLEAIEVQNPADLAGLRACLSGYDEGIGSPYFALLYVMYIDKVIFKYKYRGYRNALMEVGSMYQVCDFYAKKFGLRNRVWAGFHDGQVARRLNIDITSVLPCVVQFFGK